MAEIRQNQKWNSKNIIGLPVDSEFIFSNHKNIYKKGIEKRQTKLINQISFIKPFLKEDEKIILVTTGYSPMSFLEQFLMGWIIYYIKRSLFVFTNRRIFHIPTKSNYTYRNSIAKILYTDCQKIEIKGRSLVVKYKNGETEKFYYIAGKEKNKIKSLLKTISLEGAPSKSPRRMHLCPRCAEQLIENKYICPSCRLEFKNRAEGKKISLIYPGGGYFYTRHWWLGIGDAIAEIILLVLAITALVATLQGSKDSFIIFVLLLVLLVIEKLTSIYHANNFIKEYIPTEKEIKPIIATQ
ncbi:MAG: hypothetical protein JW914_02135 [Syntrophaceae bacterium]|nr:hypothetical protein [Syntrophaceae bacterium]